jgi:hypothetical protein
LAQSEGSRGGGAAWVNAQHYVKGLFVKENGPATIRFSSGYSISIQYPSIYIDIILPP